MITRYGMSDNFDMMGLETVANPYLGGDTSLTASAETAAQVDEEVRALIQEAHQQAIDILTENIDKLHELSKYLLENETITGEEFMEILESKEIRTFDPNGYKN
jgi:cell division protease FtsH